MARIVAQQELPPVKIDKFLGLNEDLSGSTQLQLGESDSMLNFRLSENYKLVKREGYEQLFDSLGSYPIRGAWSGKINGSTHFLFAANGNVYEHVAGVNTSIGTLTDAPTSFFAFGDKVYILNGTEYKSWDGTTYGDVAGYVPLVAIATPPAGGGTLYEQINQLTGKKRQQFSPDGTATVFQLLEKDLVSIDKVFENDVEKTTGFSKDIVNGKVTFTTAPATGTPNSIEIQWTKANNDRNAVIKHTHAMFFGGKNDTRVFFWGDGSNQYVYSDLADGVPSAEYWPVNNYRKISTDEFQVTDIIRQYDRQIIFTEREAWYSYYDSFEDVSGNLIIDFPTFPLNQSKGSKAKGQGQLINNNPFTLDGGVYQWVSTNVRDERNEVYMSKRVQPSLDTVNLSGAVTVDWQSKWEYWIAAGNVVWVYNYRLDTWYKFQLSDSVTCFLVVNDELYFGTPNGQIMKFDTDKRNDNGTPIQAVWEMNFYDFNSEWIRKYINEMFISLKPEDKETVDITYQTDRTALSQTYTASYFLATFLSTDFEKWSFKTNYNPQPFRFKIKAKKFAYFKLILSNDKVDERVTVLSINLPTRYGSKVK